MYLCAICLLLAEKSLQNTVSTIFFAIFERLHVSMKNKIKSETLFTTRASVTSFKSWSWFVTTSKHRPSNKSWTNNFVNFVKATCVTFLSPTDIRNVVAKSQHLKRRNMWTKPHGASPKKRENSEAIPPISMGETATSEVNPLKKQQPSNNQTSWNVACHCVDHVASMTV